MKKVTETKRTKIIEAYSRFTFRKIVFILTSMGALLLLVLFAISVGAANLSIGDVIRAVLSRIFPNIESTRLASIVVWELRLPGILMAIIAGAGLAISGAAMQGILRNPLVSPFTIGVSSSAALGASIAIILGFGLIGTEKYFVITNAFIFAVASAFLVIGLSRLRGITAEVLILAGIAVMYFSSAATSLLQYIATEEQLKVVIHWLFGSLSGATWEQVLIITMVLVCCLPLLIKYSWDINAIASSGDEVAISLGVNTSLVRRMVLVLSCLITAGIICFTGIIGFVCLVAPHITRMLIGADHRFLLPFSCILGAILLLLADTISRTIFSPIIIPVGIVISFIGVPFFLYLLLTRRKEYFA